MVLPLSALEGLMLQGSQLMSEGRISEAAVIFDQARWSLAETIAMSVLGIPMLEPSNLASLLAQTATTSSNNDSSSTNQQQQQQNTSNNQEPAAPPGNEATDDNANNASHAAPMEIDPLNLPAASLRTAVVQTVDQVEFIPHPNHSFQRPYEIDFFPFPVVIRFILAENLTSGVSGCGAALSPVQSLRCSAACLFSLGLCYQLNTTAPEKSAMIAMSLYQQAWSCLKDILLDPNDSSILLSMAISMNLASCSQRLGHLSIARTWNDCLSSLLTLTMPPSTVLNDNGTSCDHQRPLNSSSRSESINRINNSNSQGASAFVQESTRTASSSESNSNNLNGNKRKSALSNEVRHFFFVSTVLDGRSTSAASA